MSRTRTSRATCAPVWLWSCCALLVAGACGDRADVRAEPETCAAATVDELRACVESLREGGGRIALGAGRYELTQHVHVAYSGIHIEGAGADATRIVLADGACQAAFVIGPLALDPSATPAVRDVSIRRLAIDGNKTGNPCCERYRQPELAHLYVNGISVFHARNVELAELRIENARSGGIVTDRGVHDLTISHVVVRGSAWDGVALYQTRRSRVIGSQLEHNSAAGISLDWYADGNFFASNQVRDNGRGESGLDARSCPGADRARASPGIFVAGSSDNVFAHNEIIGNGSNGVQLDLGSDERTGSARNYFAGNVLRDNAEFGVWLIGDPSRGNLAVATLSAGNRLGPLLFTGITSPAAEHFLELDRKN